MRSYAAVILAGAVAFAAAQDFSDCEQSCISGVQADVGGDCDDGDVACYCEQPSFLDGLNDCGAEACGSSFADAYCGGAASLPQEDDDDDDDDDSADLPEDIDEDAGVIGVIPPDTDTVVQEETETETETVVDEVTDTVVDEATVTDTAIIQNTAVIEDTETETVTDETTETEVVGAGTDTEDEGAEDAEAEEDDEDAAPIMTAAPVMGVAAIAGLMLL